VWSTVAGSWWVSALGTEAVVDGCLAAATELAWARLSADLPAAPAAGVGLAADSYRAGLTASG
jgi:hypothetical protein